MASTSSVRATSPAPSPGASATLVLGVLLGVVPGAALAPTAACAQGKFLDVDREARTVTFPATLQAEAFQTSLPPDHQYHAVVSRDGSAAAKSLFVTPVADSAVAQALRELGARSEGGVPASAWSLRWVPLVPQPATRVSGSRIEILVTWEGAPRSYRLSELVEDPGGRGIDMRFGGSEGRDDSAHSGCIVCLFSCPGGVVSNAAYSIRDHQRVVTTFDPSELLPPDGTPVVLTMRLVPG